MLYDGCSMDWWLLDEESDMLLETYGSDSGAIKVDER
jgi:hypothetical protein